MSETAESPHVLTPVEVAQRLGISTRTLARWRTDKSGPPYFELPRGIVRYPAEDFETWLAQCRGPEGAEGVA